MTDEANDIDRAATGLLAELRATDAASATLALDAATPLDALPPDLVALVVGRVQAGSTAFGDDHPRTGITRRIVVPSLVLAVLDAVGLAAAAAGGHTVLAAVAGVLFVVLAYLAFAGVRFVRQDPLRVTPEQRTRVDAAKTWRSSQPWSEDERRGPWARVVTSAAAATGRIAASEAWTWASLAARRAELQLATVLDDLDAAAFRLARSGTALPAAPDPLVMRVAALTVYADVLDDLVRRSAAGEDVRTRLSTDDERRSTELAGIARRSTAVEGEPT